MKNKAIFLDRDGVINKIVKRDEKISSPQNLKEFEILPDASKSLGAFKKMGFLNIIITNQPDINRNLLKIEDLQKMHEYIIEKLPVDDIAFCPHVNEDNCPCRKPEPGLIFRSADKWSIDLAKSYMVGDSWKDILAGKAAGCKTFLLRKEYNKDFKTDYNFEINNLTEMINIIKKLDK